MKFSRNVVVIAWALFAFGAFADTATTTAAGSSAQSAPTVTVNNTVNAPDAQTPSATPTPSATSTQSSTPAQSPAPAPVPAPTQSAAPAPAPAPADKIDAKTEALKKVREEVENKDDSKVVEKLEKTRLDEEKDLAKTIDKTNLNPAESDDANGTAKDAKDQKPQVTIEKVEIVPPVQPPVAAVQDPKKDDQKKDDGKKDEKKRKWYGAIGTGGTIYSGNVTDTSAFSVMAGTFLDDNFAVEGSLGYSSYNLNNYWNSGTMNNSLFGAMDQYDLGIAAKYYVLDGSRFRPYVGGSADYIYRRYYDRQLYGAWFDGFDNYTTSQTTNSLNVGLLAGIDVKLTERLIISGEVKYSLPIYLQDNGLITQSYVTIYAQPLEQQTFTSWLLSVKFLF